MGIKLPELLPYPQIGSIDDVPGLNGVFCYVVEDYKPGYAVVIVRDNDTIACKIGDWAGDITTGDIEAHFKHIPVLVSIMRYAGVSQLEFYFDSLDKLIDVRESLNKFAGPGMLRDVFNKPIGTQNIIEIVNMTSEKIQSLKESGKSYIIKPSRYRHYTKDGMPIPMYARIS